MPSKRKIKKEAALEASPQRVRIRQSQQSYNGLNVIAGKIYEECNDDLRWPQCIKTYKQMAKDATVAPALMLLEMYISKVKWKVKIPEGYDDVLESKAQFLESVKDDMEVSWGEFIHQASTIARYGFAPMEKVFRRRFTSNGSRFNDGLVGIRNLPLISQDSVASWEWDDSGRTLSGLRQVVNIPTGKGKVQEFRQDDILIPREKFILFRADPQKDNPEGTSSLNSVYIAWRFKSEYERTEATGVSQDIRGMKVIKVPPRYLDPNATDEDKATAEELKKILRGMHTGEQSGLLLPAAYDDNGKPLFDFEVISVMGQNSHDVNAIIERFRKEIVTGLLNPQLILGQGGSGSFALANSLNGITSTVVQARLGEIRDQLNHDLIPHLFRLNGWDTSVLPYFDFIDTDSVSLDDVGKFIQRCASAGLIKVDTETVNWIAEQAGMPIPFDDEDVTTEEIRPQMTAYSSNAGEGMMSAVGEGTAKSLSDSGDTSVSNVEN